MSPRKISLTLASEKTAWRASATIGAIDTTCSESKRFSLGIGSVFDTTTKAGTDPVRTRAGRLGVASEPPPAR